MGDHVTKTKNGKTNQSNDIYILLHSESPFRWKPEILGENQYEVDVEIQEKDLFSFQNFVVKVIKSYEDFQKNNISEALAIVENVNDNLEYLRENKYSDTLFDSIGDALDHVILTCKAYILLHSSKSDDVAKVLGRIKSVDKMNNSNKAALHAIRSNVYSLYSYEGTRTAISYINIALDLDPEVPYWSFLKGLYLQKIRNLQNLNDPPPFEERALFEFANKKEPDNALFMVYVADVYREHAAHALKKTDAHFWFLPDNNAKTDLTTRIENKYKTSLELYKKSYELKPACPIVAFRCADGLMTLPQKFRDVKLAKRVLTTIGPKYPNSGFGNYVSAKYYKEFEKNLPLARRHLEKCVELNVFKGHINMIILEYQEKYAEFDAIGTLIKMLETFQESPKQGVILSQIISYHMFVNWNLKIACEYTLQYFKTHPQGNCLQVSHVLWNSKIITVDQSIV